MNVLLLVLAYCFKECLCVQNILRLLHQTFYTNNLTLDAKENIRRLQALNPDYDYHFYDDDKGAKQLARYSHVLPPDTLDTFQRVVPVMGAIKGDLLRYALLYIYGGVYLDLDSFVDVSLDTLIQPNDAFICINKTIFHQQGCVQQFMMSIPRHPLLYRVLNTSIYNLRHNVYSNNGMWFGTLQSTGPLLLAKCVKEYLETPQKPGITFAGASVKEHWIERAVSNIYGAKKHERYYYQLKKRHLVPHTANDTLTFLTKT